jgi:uncharacterized protein YjlB
MSEDNLKTFMFADDGRIPNHPILPLVVYRSALSASADRTAACRALFERNGWHGTWVNGVYRYHHYHSTAHEVLGVVSGSATIQFGGEHGEILQVQAGDVVVIPAGVGHCNQGMSSDFRVVGAYPNGQDWDLCTGDPHERPDVLDNIRRVPLPKTDPVHGGQGALLQIWHAAGERPIF